MKKLLSLPYNATGNYHALHHRSEEEWFCTSDPKGKRLGSGSRTTWLLEECYRNENPGTVLPIHRHRNTAETYIVLHGSMKVLFYNDKRELTGESIIDPKQKEYGIHLPAGQWHTLEVLEPDTVLFEVKDGPYIPFSKEDILE